MKDELTYIVGWDKEKARTWSGTPYSLLKALSNYYHIRDIDISYQPSLIRRLYNYIFKRGNDFELSRNRINRKKLKNRFKHKTKLLQFSEVLYESVDLETYIFIDLSVSYIEFLYRTNNELFNSSGFNSIKPQYIKKRLLTQNEYFKTCSGIFTMNHWLKDFLTLECGIDKNKVHHVGGGINIDYSNIKFDIKAGNKILFIGRDYKRKGFSLVYDAFLELKRTMPHAELHLAGPVNNPYPHAIEGYFFHGDCSKEQVSNLMNLCDIFCMPSYFEAYGLVFIEALTHGLPCIGRNIHEMPFFIKNGENGFLINEDNIYELSNLMYKLLHDKKILNYVKSKSQHYITEYSWETVAKRIHHIISSKSKA